MIKRGLVGTALALVGTVAVMAQAVKVDPALPAYARTSGALPAQWTDATAFTAAYETAGRYEGSAPSPGRTFYRIVRGNAPLQ